MLLFLFLVNFINKNGLERLKRLGKATGGFVAVVLLLPPLAISALVTCATLSHRAFAPLPLPDAHNASAVRSAGCGRPAGLSTGQLVYRTLDVDGVEREYLIWLPSHYAPERPYPLLLSMHGATNSPIAQVFQDQLHCLADAAPYIAAWPAGYYLDSSARYSSWNAPGATARGDTPGEGAPCIVDPTTGNWGSVDNDSFVSYASCEYNSSTGADSTLCFSAACVDDVAFITQLISSLGEEFCIDEARVSLHGHSMGGLMALGLGASSSLNSKLRAVVAWSAAPFAGYNSRPSPRAVPLLKLDGRQDWIIPSDARLSISGALGAFGSAVGAGAWLYTRSAEVTRVWADAFERDAEGGMVEGTAAVKQPNGTRVPTVLDGFRSFGCSLREGWPAVLHCEGDWRHSFALGAPLQSPLHGPVMAALAFDFADRYVRRAGGSLADSPRVDRSAGGGTGAGTSDGTGGDTLAPPSLGEPLLSLDSCSAFGARALF